MSAGITPRRSLARAAVGGLAAGFAVLATFAWVSATTTERAVDDLRSAAQISTNWDRVLTLVATENEAMNDYLRASDLSGSQPLTSAIGSAAAKLRWLAEHGSARTASQVTLIGGTYDTYTGNLTAMVEAGRRNDQRELSALAAEASLSAASLRKQLTIGIQLEHVRLNATLKKIKLINKRLRNATFIVLGVDLVLLLMCAHMLLTYQRRIEGQAERSHHRAQHDALTGLPNRVVFEEKLNDLLGPGDGDGEPFAVLMLDLDGFKAVNDTLGHQYGDMLLVAVAERLNGAVRSCDTVVRLGGDEFAILVEIGEPDQVIALAERVRTAIAVPTELNGELVRIGASIGVAFAPQHSSDSHELLRFADAAMYQAKRNKLGVRVHDSGPPPSAPDENPDEDPDETVAGRPGDNAAHGVLA